jgi:hypothetical protein
MLNIPASSPFFLLKDLFLFSFSLARLLLFALQSHRSSLNSLVSVVDHARQILTAKEDWLVSVRIWRGLSRDWQSSAEVRQSVTA